MVSCPKDTLYYGGCCSRFLCPLSLGTLSPWPHQLCQLQVSDVTHHVAFCVHPLSVTIMLLGFLVAAGASTSPHFTLTTVHCVCAHPSIRPWTSPVAPVNSVAVNTHVRGLVSIRFSFLWVCTRSGTAGSHGNQIVCVWTASVLSVTTNHFALQTAVRRTFISPHPCQHLFFPGFAVSFFVCLFVCFVNKVTRTV